MSYIIPKPNSKFRLFCFPYAGSGSSFFRRWASSLPAQVEICPVLLPGRESRLRDKPFTHMDSLVQSIACSMRPYLKVPFAFFGHSMGAMVSFELAQHLWQNCQIGPVELFVSGCRAPHLEDAEAPTYDLPEKAFLDALRDLEGTPETVLEDADMIGMMMPALRADFELVETYRYQTYPPLPVPIAAFGGIDDFKVKSSHLQSWSQHTAESFQLNMLPGNHFFLHKHQSKLLNLLARRLHQICLGLEVVVSQE
jgi:medium-chain acyl-[acyl-carrier-protein] hydrolase